ncbi:MAG: TIGR02391 family protein [Gammaproteobacteria bacterium]|nr:TIGR02391 family protein [Gammaproteobacteria bacterium]
MSKINLDEWQYEVLTRLDGLEQKARHCRQYLVARRLNELEDSSPHKSTFNDSCEQIEGWFPTGFKPNRINDLRRHAHFAMLHDFYDIELHDIPAIKQSVLRYGRKSESFIHDQLKHLRLDSTVTDALHPLIKDSCISSVRKREYRQAGLAAISIVMDEIRRLSDSQEDGDQLIRKVIGTQPGKIAFSGCNNDNAKSVTNGLKQITQGLYKGVRNPASHGWDDFGKLEVVQVMVICSLLLNRLQIVEDPIT